MCIRVESEEEDQQIRQSRKEGTWIRMDKLGRVERWSPGSKGRFRCFTQLWNEKLWQCHDPKLFTVIVTDIVGSRVEATLHYIIQSVNQVNENSWLRELDFL